MAGQPQQLKASFCCLTPDVSCSCCPGVKKPWKLAKDGQASTTYERNLNLLATYGDVMEKPLRLLFAE